MRRWFMILVFLVGMLVLSVPGAGAAEEPESRELTVEQAVELAMKNSVSLKNGQYEINQTYEKRKISAQNVSFEPYGGSEASVISFFTALQQADLKWQIARKNYMFLEDSVEYATHQAYNAILQAQGNLKVLEKEKKSAEQSLIVANATYRVGMMDQLTLQQAEAAVTTAKSSYEEALKKSDDLYQQFNYLVGLAADDRPQLTEKPVFEPVEVIELNNYIERKMAENPGIWEAEQNVTLAKSALSYYQSANSNENSATKNIEVDKSLLAESDAKEKFRKGMRTLYYSIGMQEEKYPMLEENIKVAEESLRVANLKYDLGMITSTDLLKAENTLAQAEKSMLDLLCQHDIDRLAFEKPWAYGL